MRAAVVLPGEGWTFEEGLALKRVAGALACALGEVDVLIAGAAGPPDLPGPRSFPSSRPPEVASPALRNSALLTSCGACGAGIARAARTVPAAVQDRCVAEQGGLSPALNEHLAQGGYDLVVFGGFRFASTVFGMAALPSGTRAVLAACATPSLLLHLPVYDPVFARPDAIIAFSGAEAALAGTRSGSPAKVHDTAFAVRVDTALVRSRPGDLPDDPYFLAVGDPGEDGARPMYGPLSLLAVHSPSLRVVFPAPDPAPREAWLRRRQRQCAARADVWRLASGARAVVDFCSSRLIGLGVVEGMLAGRPVVVPASGTQRPMVESSGGGLWFHSIPHLAATLEHLAAGAGDAEAMGVAGRKFAEWRFGDPDAFIDAVAGAVEAALA